jgi:NADPH-dependent glutamate synthase beta subunit-like oxidoreductase
MVNIIIDKINLAVKIGTPVIDAARSAGINIPSMCYKNGYSNHPSCMVCMVKDMKTGKLFPSCAIKVTYGMEISTTDDDVLNARKEALELLLSDHIGDCVAPCQPTCPANMDIPKMNRLIATGDFDEALKVVKEDIALPLILGYICPAPCEKACRRGEFEKPISICLLKKFVAAEDFNKENFYLPSKEKPSNKKVGIIGSGPAGLAAAFYLLKFGHQVTLFDKNENAGGSLRYEKLENPLPIEALEKELDLLKLYGASFELSKRIDSDSFRNTIRKEFDATIIATGNYDEKSLFDFGLEATAIGLTINRVTHETNIKGVFACGNTYRSRRMAIHSLAQGKIAAESANMYLKGLEPKGKPQLFNSKFGKLFESEFQEYLKESTPDSRVELSNGKLGDFSKEQAMLEAARCMHCDCRKLDNCKLRDLSTEYNADRKKFLFGERKTLKKYDQHGSVIYEPEKCIRCNLCVDITVKNNELVGLSSVGRGFKVEINIPFDNKLSEALAKTADEVVQSCPTGALSFK